jgi:type III secretion system FlhB-like substrate exporter
MKLVGLRYEPAEGLPQVILKASGAAADEVLRQRLRMLEAPAVVRNQALLEQLYRLPVDGRIGPELFQVVAILLAHVLSIDAKLKGVPHA